MYNFGVFFNLLTCTNFEICSYCFTAKYSKRTRSGASAAGEITCNVGQFRCTSLRRNNRRNTRVNGIQDGEHDSNCTKESQEKGM